MQMWQTGERRQSILPVHVDNSPLPPAHPAPTPTQKDYGMSPPVHPIAFSFRILISGGRVFCLPFSDKLSLLLARFLERLLDAACFTTMFIMSLLFYLFISRCLRLKWSLFTGGKWNWICLELSQTGRLPTTIGL